MTSIGNGHLTDKQLLFYVDGEVSSGEGARIRGHLEACWSCRSKLEDLQATIKKIVGFRDQVLLPMVPPPPRPWDGLDPRLHEMDATLGKPSLADRLSSLFRSMVLAPRYAVFAVLILTAVAALIWLPSQPIVSANELLARARAEQSAEMQKVAAPVLHQRLRVRRRSVGSNEQASADYDSWEDQSRGRFRQIGSSAEILTELRTIFNANQLDWQAPLSAVGYARWRDSLAAKEDIVAPAQESPSERVTEGAEPLALTTIDGSEAVGGGRSRDSGTHRITKAELVVRTADWHPVEERLWVNDRVYEIAELDYKVLPLSEVDALVFAEPTASAERVEPPHAVPTDMVARALPPPPDPEETEMEVRYGLHQLDADLGEPIEISRSSEGKIVVDASGVAPELQAKLEHRLALIPTSGLEIDTTPNPACDACAPPPATQEAVLIPPAPMLNIAPMVNPNEKRLEEIFGDPHAQESFTQEVLAASGDALSQGFALRALALRYTAEEEAKLNTTTRAKLTEMVGDHIGAVAEETNRLQGLLRPLLEALSNSSTPSETAQDVAPAGRTDDPARSRYGVPLQDVTVQGPPSAEAGGATSSWRIAVLDIFAAVQKADRLVKGLLTNTNSPLPAEEAVPELRQALTDQQQELKQYQERVRQVSTATDK